MPTWAIVLISFTYGVYFGIGLCKAIRDSSWVDFALAVMWAGLAVSLALMGGK